MTTRTSTDVTDAEALIFPDSITGLFRARVVGKFHESRTLLINIEYSAHQTELQAQVWQLLRRLEARAPEEEDIKVGTILPINELRHLRFMNEQHDSAA